MLTTLEWPVTLVMTMRIQVFGDQWQWCSDRLGQNGVDYFELRILFF